MSTTLQPQTYYMVKPDGQTARVYQTLAQAATAMTLLGGIHAQVAAITGSQVRELTVPEQRELDGRLGTHSAPRQALTPRRSRRRPSSRSTAPADRATQIR